MDKLYYIVCEDNDTTLFEGRYQGRTRGAALKFLKQTLGRKSLNGLVFTITEIPVPLIREIVAEILAGSDGMAASNVVPLKAPEPEPKVERYDAFAEAGEPDSPPSDTPAPKKPAQKKRTAKVGNPGLGDDLWSKARDFWKECRSIKQTAEKFGLSPNTVKTRARRENWREEA